MGDIDPKQAKASTGYPMADGRAIAFASGICGKPIANVNSLA
jgi:hypothetical protein